MSETKELKYLNEVERYKIIKINSYYRSYDDLDASRKSVYDEAETFTSLQWWQPLTSFIAEVDDCGKYPPIWSQEMRPATPGEVRSHLRDIIKRKERRILIEIINELSADEPCPCDLHTFSDETLIDFLRDLIKEKEQLAADAELDACCEWLNTGHYDFSCAGNNLISQLKQNRRPKPTLKSQALRDFETVKKLNPDMLPEILGTIEKALNSIPE